jgi:transcriptional regulator with XRE-family HTH domain
VSDQRVGAAFRAVRLRRGWRQIDVASRAGVSASLVSALERGHLAKTTVDLIRRVGDVLEVRIDVVPRWRGPELDRLLNARHARLTEAVAGHLKRLGWEVVPEVSFSVYGERGFIDLLAWHPGTRILLVIEIKTELVDVQDMLGLVDRKTRLAPAIARDRVWVPAEVATWVVLAEGSTNRHRADVFSNLLGGTFPTRGRAMDRWLRDPNGSVRALSFFSISSPGVGKQQLHGRQRVRVAKPDRSERAKARSATANSGRPRLSERT